MAHKQSSAPVDLSEVNDALAAAQSAPAEEFDPAILDQTEELVFVIRYRLKKELRNPDGTINFMSKSEMPMVMKGGKVLTLKTREEAHKAADWLRARSFTTLYWPSCAPKSEVEELNAK